MKMRMNPAISKMSSKLNCDYLFALGLYLVLDEMSKAGEMDKPIDDRFMYDLGFMSTKMSRNLSTEKRDILWDIYRDTKVDIRRDMERDKKRDFRERKRNAPSSPLSPTPPITPISPKEKEIGVTPPISQSDMAPQGATPPEKSPRKRFKKPTVDEVRDYAREIGFNLNAEAFVDYYEANGWKAGKNPMQDWKASVRLWKRRDDEKRVSSPLHLDTRTNDGFRPLGKGDRLI